MNSISIKKESIGIASLLAVSVIAPIIYHAIGMQGTVFLPIFLGIIIGSYYLSPISLFSVALVSPILNHILTGMPPLSPFPVLYLITFEGVVLAFFYIYIRRLNTHPFVRAFLPIILARFSVVLLLPFVNMTFSIWTSNLLIGIPGILLNTTGALMVHFYFFKD